VGELPSGAQVDHVLARRAEEAGRLPGRQQVFVSLSHTASVSLNTKNATRWRLVVVTAWSRNQRHWMTPDVTVTGREVRNR
jgi:hypothetical protein